MKTSFYFVLWILIYPILGLFDNSFIDNNAFLIALCFVWGLSFILGRLMPDTNRYEMATQLAPIFEDVYTGHVMSFKRRLSQKTRMEVIAAVYFIITTIVVVMTMRDSDYSGWMTLAIFLFFTIGTVSISISLVKACLCLRSNPTPEQCVEISENTLKLNYAAYYEERKLTPYQYMLPGKLRHFKAFAIFSIVISAVRTTD